MKHLFIPYELEQKAIQLGLIKVQLLDEFGLVIEGILYQQIVDCFRDEHNIIIEVRFSKDHYKNTNHTYRFILEGSYVNIKGEGGCIYGDHLENYYESLNKAIEEAFKLI